MTKSTEIANKFMNYRLQYQGTQETGGQGDWSRRHYMDITYRFGTPPRPLLIPYHEDPRIFFKYSKSSCRETMKVGRTLEH